MPDTPTNATKQHRWAQAARVVRPGFVDTKMATSDVRPFMISADEAAALVVRCMRKRPIRYTYPKRMAALLWLARWGPRLRIWLS